MTAAQLDELSRQIELRKGQVDELNCELFELYLRRQGAHIQDSWFYCFACGQEIVKSPARVCYRCSPYRTERSKEMRDG